jgi:hypothetical protein
MCTSLVLWFCWELTGFVFYLFFVLCCSVFLYCSVYYVALCIMWFCVLCVLCGSVYYVVLCIMCSVYYVFYVVLCIMWLCVLCVLCIMCSMWFFVLCGSVYYVFCVLCCSVFYVVLCILVLSGNQAEWEACFPTSSLPMTHDNADDRVSEWQT